MSAKPENTATGYRYNVKQPPPKEWLNELLEYRPHTKEGTFWKIRPDDHFKDKNPLFAYIWNARFAGTPAGSNSYKHGVKTHKRIQIPLFKGGPLKTFSVHRLAYAMMGVAIPDGLVVDHKNNDPWDNSWNNLRLGTPQQNSFNSKRRKNKSEDLPKGVFRDKRNGRFFTMLILRGKNHRFGVWDTVELAHAAVVAGASKVHGEFARIE